jgi:hypothetical protein
MDTYKMTTYLLYYAFQEPPFTIDRWLLSTRRADVDAVRDDGRTELMVAIDDWSWRSATGLIEVGKANIDETHLWNHVDWSSMAKDNSEESELFLRALLPRVDFPSHVCEVLMNTPSTDVYVHRELVLKGIAVRKRVKALHQSRVRYVRDLRLPGVVKEHKILSFLGDNQMDMTTKKMWTSI